MISGPVILNVLIGVLVYDLVGRDLVSKAKGAI